MLWVVLLLEGEISLLLQLSNRGLQILCQIYWYLELTKWFPLTKAPLPTKEKQPHSMMLPSPMLYTGCSLGEKLFCFGAKHIFYNQTHCATWFKVIYPGMFFFLKFICLFDYFGERASIEQPFPISQTWRIREMHTVAYSRWPVLARLFNIAVGLLAASLMSFFLSFCQFWRLFSFFSTCWCWPLWCSMVYLMFWKYFWTSSNRYLFSIRSCTCFESFFVGHGFSSQIKL